MNEAFVIQHHDGRFWSGEFGGWTRVLSQAHMYRTRDLANKYILIKDLEDCKVITIGVINGRLF